MRATQGGIKMKEKMRALLLQNPDITLPEAARALNANERNCKSVRVAYWQARALLMEELTGKTLRALLDEGHIQGGHEGPFYNEGHMTYEGHKDDMDHMDEGPFDHSVSTTQGHSVSSMGDHSVSKEELGHSVSLNEDSNINVSYEDIDQVFGPYDISDF